MPHQSRLCQILVDVPESDFEATTNFWSGALGAPVEPPHGALDEYRVLGWVVPGIHMEMQRIGGGTEMQRIGGDLEMQRIGGGARVHLDIESDDVEAEVARLVALGAHELERHQDWVVMHDPAGLPFCVVPNFSEQFASQATRWP